MKFIFIKGLVVIKKLFLWLNLKKELSDYIDFESVFISEYNFR